MTYYGKHDLSRKAVDLKLLKIEEPKANGLPDNSVFALGNGQGAPPPN